MPDIFLFTDSRRFLKEYYDERKKVQSTFSYQFFANRAGFKSKTFIYKVISGQKALSKSAVLAIAQAIDLNKRETDYFEAMVNFTQAKTDREREFYFNHLQALGGSHRAVALRKEQFAYFSQWYLPALREIVTYADFKNDFKALARMCDPPITAVKAKKAVKLLVDLGLVRRGDSGRYVQTDTALTTENTVRSVAVMAFQKECMRLGAESLERHPRKSRDVSTLTIGTSEAGMNMIKEEVAAFRKRIIKLAERAGPVDRVCQLNIQLFPLSTLPKKG